jgi:Protein of unknown function (DUF2510)
VSTAKVMLGLKPDFGLGEAGGAIATGAGVPVPSLSQDVSAGGAGPPLRSSDHRAESDLADHHHQRADIMSTPAGWYPQPDGQQRYWDGQQWTESFAPGAATPVTTPATGGELARLWPENEHVNRMSDQLTPAPQVVPVPVEVNGSNGLAVAGFVLALLGALSSFIPIVNIGGDFLALLGLIFGIIGLVQSGKRAAGRGLSIAAIILAVVAFVISIVVDTATVKAVNDAVKTFPTAPATPGPEATSSPAATEPTPTTPPASEHPGVGGTATINDSAGGWNDHPE